MNKYIIALDCAGPNVLDFHAEDDRTAQMRMLLMAIEYKAPAILMRCENLKSRLVAEYFPAGATKVKNP